jgi:hypothetical protein
MKCLKETKIIETRSRKEITKSWGEEGLYGELEFIGYNV